MPYLICDKCNIYYEIEKIEEMEEFHNCECGNELKFYDTLEDYMNEDPDSSIATEEESKGIFYSINKKNLVDMQMNMLKDQKETEEHERSIRDLRYRIRHAISKNKEKSDDYEPIIAKEFGDNSLKKKKELQLREMELLIKAKKEK